MILAADVGGTKCNLALFRIDGKKLTPVIEATYPSRDYAGLEEVALEFFKRDDVKQERQKIVGTCFGVAGPVIDEKIKTPNLPWVITRDGLREKLGLDKLHLINDLESTGYGVSTLKPAEVLTLNEGDPDTSGNAALIAAGTGLGEAILIKEEDDYVPVASEGGHSDFAPRNDREIELLRYLMNKFGHVSYERVLSGPGLFNVYSFLKDSGYGEEPEWLTQRIEQGDPSAAVSQAGLNEESDLCVQALDLFVSIYGAEAGNLALKVKSLDGLYVGGGIAPRIAKKLQDGQFMKAFIDKGRLERLMHAIPVKVILNPKTALYGSAQCAYHFYGKRG